MIERVIRRGISDFSSIGRGEKILVLDTFIPYLWLIPTIHILHNVLRNYGNKTIFLAYPWTLSVSKEVSGGGDLWDEVIEIPVSRVNEFVNRCASIYTRYEDNITCLLKINLLNGLENALERDIKYLAMLCPRDNCFRISLKNIFHLNNEIVSEIFPRRNSLGVEIFNSLYYVSEEDLLAYSVVSGIHRVFNKVINRFMDLTGLDKILFLDGSLSNIYSMINEIIYSGSREMIYASTDALVNIYARYNRCILCNSPLIESGSDRLCRFCGSLLPLFKSLQKIS